MRTLMVGDVHGCASSLEALIAAAHTDAVILLGDLFAKGPDPLRTWEIIRDTGARSVMGNHDWRLLQVWGKPGDSAHHVAARLLPDEAHAWLAALPLFLHGEGWVAVHAGLHPFEGEAATTRSMAMTVRRWPDDTNLENPFWWQLYEGTTRVYYGHDAMRGVQHHPRTVGLDSGAVYGGLLSGVIREEDEVVQVAGWVR